MGAEIVVDASAFVDLLLYIDGPPPGVDIRGSALNAPTVVDYEFLSSARRMARVAPTRLDSIHAAIAAFTELTINRHEAAPLLPRMWTFRHNMSAYDSSYVALAEALNAPLVTTDMRLARSAERYCDVLTF